jgi:hypothetical protein
VFDDATARDAAVTSPEEGNACYLKDTNEVLTYSGSVWVAVGGGSPLTTKGDLFTFSTTDARLAVGANGTTLVADSAEATGLKWVTAGGGGKVLQVIQATSTTDTTVASTSFTDTTLSATITPTLASSKILILINQFYYFQRNNNEAGHSLKILRDSTDIYTTDGDPGSAGGFYGVGTTTLGVRGITALSYLDSPATTSSRTYKTQGKANDTSNSGLVRYQLSSATSVITLLEIGA